MHLGVTSRTTIPVSSLLVLSVCAFLYYVPLADAAMDKSGIGNLASWQSYQARAGVAFWLAAVVWSGLVTV